MAQSGRTFLKKAAVPIIVLSIVTLILTIVLQNDEKHSSLVQEEVPIRAQEIMHRNLAEKVINPKKKLFFCASTMSDQQKQFIFLQYGVKIMTDAFPEIGDPKQHTPIILETISDVTTQNASPGDIMIIYWGMYNCNVHPDEFPGQTVVFSGEAPTITDPTGERVYYIGPNEDSGNSIMIPYLTMRIHSLWENNGGRGREKIFEHSKKEFNDQTNFLLYAVSNCQAYFREEAFDKLADLGLVHQGGECWGMKKDRSKVVENIEYDKSTGANNNEILFKRFRFALVMENSDRPGYISEKILNAFLGGSIPIWFGTTNIFQIFNREAFIFYDIHNPQPALDQIKYLESNRTAYTEMLTKQPILADGARTIERFFSFNDSVGKGFMKKRIRSMMGQESAMYHYGLIQHQAIFA
eukprot:CAMPEP_0194375390 /NCGR_PEP_ID=MMETSP0174-20130528/23894_1 /TAXON_ID=216777 /ORGANISM="Proboscia alata, Strain PI-D3" /LENGTH=409 /DNA_ID=CAMNT_0039155549 /DNA_START=20 /DNA_END=1249 /DNA_ORIENTATION=-